eukprot:9937-Heterococcus_DN1.PRE.1
MERLGVFVVDKRGSVPSWAVINWSLQSFTDTSSALVMRCLARKIRAPKRLCIIYLIERAGLLRRATFQEDFAKLLVNANAKATCRQPSATKAYLIESSILSRLQSARLRPLNAMESNHRPAEALLADLLSSEPRAFTRGLTQVAALPVDDSTRQAIAERGGLLPMVQALQHTDVKVTCKAANSLSAMAMAPGVARLLLEGPLAAEALSSLTAMADALSCLSWLAGSGPCDTLHSLAPTVMRLLQSHLERVTAAAGASDHSSAGSSATHDASAAAAAVQERDDNLVLYAQLFLLQLCASCPALMDTWCAEQSTQQQQQHPSLPAVLLSVVALLRQQGLAREAQSQCLAVTVRLLHLCALSHQGQRALLQLRCVPALVQLRDELRRNEAAAAASNTGRSHSATCCCGSHTDSSSSGDGGSSNGIHSYSRDQHDGHNHRHDHQHDAAEPQQQGAVSSGAVAAVIATMLQPATTNANSR